MMKQWVIIFTFFFAKSVLLIGQEEQQIIYKLEKIVERANSIDSIFITIENYDKYCKNNICLQQEYIDYLKISYEWQIVDSNTLKKDCTKFNKKYPRSSFFAEIEKLLEWKVDQVKSLDEIKKLSMTASLDQLLLLCNQYQSIGSVYMLCRQRQKIFQYTIKDSMQMEDGKVLHFVYSGHEGMAPNIASSVKDDIPYFEIISNNSKESKIFFNNKFKGNLNFSISGSPWKECYYPNLKKEIAPIVSQSSDVKTIDNKIKAPISKTKLVVGILTLLVLTISIWYLLQKTYDIKSIKILPNAKLKKLSEQPLLQKVITTEKTEETREFLKFNSSNSKYIEIDLSFTWKSSHVKILNILPKTIRAIQAHIMTPEFSGIEIGGFLIGEYTKSGDHYIVSVNDYISIESSDQSEFQIEFGMEAWTKLEKTLEFSDQKLVGWFHTHPGHGVFLSRPDRNIITNFFNKPYHIAMEIDPLEREKNINLDTAFFSMKLNGDINNSSDVLDRWFSWKEFLNIANTIPN